MSNFYRNNYVINGDRVSRVIDTNEMIAERMQAIEKAQRQARREELLRQRREAMEAAAEDGEIEFTEGLFAENLDLEPEPEPEEPEVDYVAQAKEEAAQLLAEAGERANEMHDQAVFEAQQLRETAQKEGYAAGYEEAQQKAQAELDQERARLEALEQHLREEHAAALAGLEPKLLDTVLHVFDEVFRIQFSDKREMLLQLVMNAMRGIRETKQYKIRVCEDEVAFLREKKGVLQEKVGEDVSIEIVMDPELSKSQCIIDADSGVYDCSLDVELDNLVRDLKSLCVRP